MVLLWWVLHVFNLAIRSNSHWIQSNLMQLEIVYSTKNVISSFKIKVEMHKIKRGQNGKIPFVVNNHIGSRNCTYYWTLMIMILYARSKSSSGYVFVWCLLLIGSLVINRSHNKCMIKKSDHMKSIHLNPWRIKFCST